ncbi:MAG: Gx transporter family protein [Clostridiales bacterium]|nr:Gx transporter family protein [Clostridiales bacterium]
MRKQRKSARVALYGMLIALAFVFSWLEAMLPVVVPVPGVKLGLANLVTMVGLYTVGIIGTAGVSLARIILAGFTFGNASSMLYALAGGVVSLAVMALAKKANWFGRIGVSVLGGIFHNIGQLCVAAWVTRTAGVFVYLPALLAAGVITGALIGLLGGLVMERVGESFRRGWG